MTQIFTGSGLGTQGSSIGLGSYGPKGVAGLGQGGESVYVNAANGNLVLRQTDGFLADMGFGLNVLQTYNSRGEGGGSWCFNLQSRLEFFGEAKQEGSWVIRVDEDGHRSRFTWDVKKQIYLPDEGGTARLTLSADGWTYKEGSQKTSCCYNTQGQMTDIQDADGHRMHFAYQDNQLITITDNSGKQQITWSFKQGLLQDLTTTSEGGLIHHLHYDYDEHNRLHKVTRDLGNGKSYWITYDYAGDSNWISDIKQSDGTQLHIDYDEQGRVKQLIDGEGRTSTYEYGQGQTTVTNDLDEAWTYFYDENNRLTGIDGPEHYRVRYYYDGKQLSSIVQGEQVWKFGYNEEGDCTRIEEPNGQITRRIYDATHHVISETQYQSFDGNHYPVKPKTTRYVYDERGHLLFVIAADGTVTERRYDHEGQLTSTRCYLQAAYDISAMSEQDLLSQDVLDAWAARQNQQDVSLVDYIYDWRGQLIEEIHYSRVSQEGVGVLTGALHTRMRYDAAGRLMEKSTPTAEGWNTIQYFYDDLDRLIRTVDQQNHNQRIEYDDAHQRIIQTDANGLQTVRIYDSSGLLLATLRLDNSHSFGTTHYQYDAAGRLVAETGFDGLTTYYFYDEQGRVKAKVNGSGQVTEYLYNDAGFLLQTHQYEQHKNTKGWLDQIPEYEQIKPQYSSLDRVSQLIYNRYNQIAYRIDAEGAAIGYTYDAEGRVIASTAYANKLSPFNSEMLLSFDSISLRMDAENDRNTFYYYDTAGRLQAEVNGEGAAVTYTYNRLGLLIETCRYFNKVQKPLNGEWAQDKPIINEGRDIHSYSLYDARGLKTAIIDGEGYLTEYFYNEQGLVQEQCAYEHAVKKPMHLDEQTTVESIRPLSGTNDHHSYYQYNDSGLLCEEKSHNGLITTYAYDEMGQLILKSRTDEKTQFTRQQRTRYDALGRVIQQLDELGCAKLGQPDLSIAQIEQLWQQHSIHLTYNAAGLLQTKTDALQHITRYFYDDARRLKYTMTADGAVTETGYNAFNQVETVRKYSAFLKGSLQALNTEDIKSRLESLKDERFDETTSYEYNSMGQVILKRTGSYGLITSSYNSFGELTFSTESIDTQHNVSKSYSYDRRGLLKHQVDDVGGLSKETSIQYDSFGWIKAHIDGRKETVSYTLNKRGEKIILFNASTQFKKITYDAFGRLLSETDYSGTKRIAQYIYDDKNNKLTLTNPNIKTEITTQYNAFGDKISIKDANGNSTNFQYNEQGQLIQTDLPEQAFKKYHYDDAGQLLWQEDEGGHIIAYSYDAQGHLLTKTVDPDGLKLTTAYKYDALGRQLQITEANNSIKRFTYDDQGRLTQSCIDPDGLNRVTQFTYDARGLLHSQTELNASGKNKVIAYQWDSLCRRSATIIDPDGLALATYYEYDENNNLTCQTDANQHSTHFVYDANNQCRYQIDARGVVTQHLYDVNGNEIETVTYARRIDFLSEYSESSVKAAIIQDNNFDQYQFRVFDSAGRITCSYDALGYAILYKYDGNGNLIQKSKCVTAVSLDDLKCGDSIYPNTNGAQKEYFIYDGFNQLRFQCNNNGSVTELQYDANGAIICRTQYAQNIKLSEEIDYTIEFIQQNIKSNAQKDKTTRYAYDKAGRLSLEISAQGTATSYQYNGLNQVISSTRYATLLTPDSLLSLDLNQVPKSVFDRTSYFAYDAAGREVYRISNEGRVVERRYDGVGNVISQVTHAQNIHLTQYTTRAIQKALENQDTDDRIADYEYDAAGRLVTETNAKKAITSYVYDAQGNVLNKTDADKARWTYSYDEANQLIESSSPITSVSSAKGTEHRSVITRTVYDSFGNAITVIRDATGMMQTRHYEYDNANHQIKVTYPDVAINHASSAASNQRQEVVQTLTEETQYNAFGDVIASKDKAGNWKHFAYNAQGLLTYSVDTLGGLTQYDYDTFGRITTKTLYETPIRLDNNDYSLKTIDKARRAGEHDRHEYSEYDRDDHLIESSRDAVRLYNSKTNQYGPILKPVTQRIYNAFGEVVQTKARIDEAQWAITTTYYNQDGNKTAVIDAEGYLTTYTLNTFGEIQSTTEYASRAPHSTLEEYSAPQENTKDRTVTYTYDALGQMSSKTLKQVSVQRITKGLPETFTSDLTTTYSYDALGNLTCTKDAKGNSAYCYYNELGQLIAKIAPKAQDGRAATTYSYDALGNLVDTHQWAQGALDADTEHFTLNVSDKNDIIRRQVYSSEGQLLSDTDGLSNTVYYSYDANGNLARGWNTLTQADKSTLIQDKRYLYDSEHHLLQTATIKDNGGQKTDDAQYNMFGEVIAKGIDGHYTTHVDYDTSGRVWRSNTQGYYQIYIYNLMDHVTQVITSTSNYTAASEHRGVDLSSSYFTDMFQAFDHGKWHYDLTRQNNSYDALGHLLNQNKEFTISLNAHSNERHLEYSQQTQTADRWGNMLSYTSALGYETRYEYNAFNQVIRQELPEVSVMDQHGVVNLLKPVNTYFYNELGQAIGMTDANGHFASKDYDAEGRIIAETDAKGAIRTRHYNLLNQQDRVTNELEGVTTYVYDKANRLLSVTTPKTNQSYSYDEAGHLISQRNGKNETTTFRYDVLDNQIERKDARGYKTTYEYDDVGHKTKETDALSKSQTWVYNEEGHLQAHTDLGGHITSYEYNTNGQVLHEYSTAGKNIHYYYQGNGLLIQYIDEAHHESIEYDYDAEEQVLSKASSRVDGYKNGWDREVDNYQYDTQGRLSHVRRHKPEFTDKDDVILAIDYDYDAVGNIRHTNARARYMEHPQISTDEYYDYDANNRMTLNKGQLVNGEIILSKTQGSSLSYDAAGNIKEATKYENGTEQHYQYQYNNDNQLETIKKNDHLLQSKGYDAAGRVITERSFDTNGRLSQINSMTYVNGILEAQRTENGYGAEQSTATYDYDHAGNMEKWALKVTGINNNAGYQLTHTYEYELWDSYQQKKDTAKLTIEKHTTTKGESTRYYDKNGKLQESIDAKADNDGKTNSINYWNSGVDGMRARADRDGMKSYLNVGGKVIGDLFVDYQGKQQLNVYSGFTPTGSADTTRPAVGANSIFSFLNRIISISNADGTIPESSQDNLGSYTIQAGDSLDSIALQVYGDSSLWYLIADANGLTNSREVAGNEGGLRVGLRLNLPPVATGQHHTNATQKVMNANQMIGNTGATTPLPPPPAPPKQHNNIFAKIIVGVVAVVATVLTAGALGIAFGVAGAASVTSLGALFSLGGTVLAGGMATLGGTLAAGFTAGFIGSIASQGVANALGMQKGLDVTGAFISGLATAATAGIGYGLNNITSVKEVISRVNEYSINKGFSPATAAEMMEQNAASQGLNTALRRHQHFDWIELGAATITGGLMGSGLGKQLGEHLGKADHYTGILNSELRSAASAGVQALAGAHFNAIDVVLNNLGSAIGSGIVGQMSAQKEPTYIYGSELQGFVGEVLYDDSIRPTEGAGALALESLPPIQLAPHEDYKSLSFDSPLFTPWNSSDGLSGLIDSEPYQYCPILTAENKTDEFNSIGHVFNDDSVIRSETIKKTIELKDLVNKTELPLVAAITDREFLDKDSLSQEQIKKIINKHNPKLINKYNADKYIYQAAQNYEINPKALLASLQQEQSWGLNGKIEKAMGIGTEGHPISLQFKVSVDKAAAIYRKWYDVGLKNLQMEKTAALKLNYGFSFVPRTAAEYSRLQYTPWTYYDVQKSRPYDQWVTAFRSFK